MGTRLRNLSRLVLMFVAMATALVALPLAGSAQGNSGATRACQQGNYADLLGSNGETFANPGQCARFAAQGGTFATFVAAGHTVTFNSTLAGCNHLAFGYAASDGSGGEIDEKPYNCEILVDCYVHCGTLSDIGHHHGVPGRPELRRHLRLQWTPREGCRDTNWLSC